MNPEIENLINMALADGEVTEKERAIILRKAEALGFDRDEVEMILDGKIALQKKELSHSESSKENTSNKAGDIKKCPSCGAPVPSFKQNAQIANLSSEMPKLLIQHNRFLNFYKKRPHKQ